MKKAIAAIVHHCSDNDNMDERRKFCPCNEKTWCHKYTKEHNWFNFTYIFAFWPWQWFTARKMSSWSNTKLQRGIESIDLVEMPKRCIWGKITIEIGVFSAILSFNEGNAGLLRVYDKAGIIPGNFTKVGFMLTGVKRVTSTNRKSSEGETQISCQKEWSRWYL